MSSSSSFLSSPTHPRRFAVPSPAPRSRVARRQAAQPHHRGTGAAELHVWHAAFAAANSPVMKPLSSPTSQHAGARWSSIRSSRSLLELDSRQLELKCSIRDSRSSIHGSRSSANQPHVPTCLLSYRPHARQRRRTPCVPGVGACTRGWILAQVS